MLEQLKQTKTMQTLKQYKGTIATAAISAVVGGLLTGALMNKNLEQQAEEAIQEALGRTYPFSISLSIDNEGKKLALPTSFSDIETINGDEKERTWLAQRLGFEYTYEDTVPGNLQSVVGLPNLFGIGFRYQVENSIVAPHKIDAVETLVIENYEGTVLPSTRINLQDWDRDGRLDYIAINDMKNNTDITIRREKTRFGEIGEEMNAENADAESAAHLIDYYTACFHKFKQEHEIEDRLKHYQTKLEIRESYTEKITRSEEKLSNAK